MYFPTYFTSLSSVSHTGFGPSIMSLTGPDCPCRHLWAGVLGQVPHTGPIRYYFTVKLIIPQHCSFLRVTYRSCPSLNTWSFPKVIQRCPDFPLDPSQVAGPSPGQLNNSLSFSELLTGGSFSPLSP